MDNSGHDRLKELVGRRKKNLFSGSFRLLFVVLGFVAIIILIDGSSEINWWGVLIFSALLIIMPFGSLFRKRVFFVDSSIVTPKKYGDDSPQIAGESLIVSFPDSYYAEFETKIKDSRKSISFCNTAILGACVFAVWGFFSVFLAISMVALFFSEILKKTLGGFEKAFSLATQRFKGREAIFTTNYMELTGLALGGNMFLANNNLDTIQIPYENIDSFSVEPNFRIRRSTIPERYEITLKQAIIGSKGKLKTVSIIRKPFFAKEKQIIQFISDHGKIDILVNDVLH